MHGGMEELARQCGFHTPAELAALKARHQAELTQQGQMTASAFEQAHAQGITEVKARFEPLDPTQKTKVCDATKRYQALRPQPGR